MINEVLTALGEHLCKADSHRQMASESLIQTWWKIASSLKSTNHFLQVLEPWLQFACTHLSVITAVLLLYTTKCAVDIQFILKSNRIKAVALW